MSTLKPAASHHPLPPTPPALPCAEPLSPLSPLSPIESPFSDCTFLPLPPPPPVSWLTLVEHAIARWHTSRSSARFKEVAVTWAPFASGDQAWIRLNFARPFRPPVSLRFLGPSGPLSPNQSTSVQALSEGSWITVNSCPPPRPSLFFIESWCAIGRRSAAANFFLFWAGLSNLPFFRPRP